MKKKLLTIALIACTAISASAQLSSGKVNTNQMRIGNRPSAGDWGIYLGATTNQFKDLTLKGAKVQGLPLINLKYYWDDNIEFRAGIKAWGKSQSLSGQVFENTQMDETSKMSGSISESDWMISPGIAYHFNKTNILDVYVGGELPIGWETNTTKTTNGKNYFKTSSSPFKVGLGAFIGLQVFIADLPLSLGLEYGLKGMWYMGADKTKHTNKVDGKETKWYSSSKEDYENNKFDTLLSNNTVLGSEARIIISYYFK